MYRFSRWLYELGTKHEYERIRTDMRLYFSIEPIPFEDKENGIKEDADHFNKRLDGWFAARKQIAEYFDGKGRNEDL